MYKLLCLYKLVNGYVSCPYGLLVFYPNPNLRVSHEKQLVQSFVRTSAFFNSFFISSIRAWNSLPSEIVLCNKCFKSVLPFLIVVYFLFSSSFDTSSLAIRNLHSVCYANR